MKEFIKGLSAGMLALIITIVLIVGVSLVGVFGFGWFTDATANRQGRTQQEQLVQGNGQYRIAAYEHFYDLCATVQTDWQTVQFGKEEMKGVTDQGRLEQLQANLAAQQIKLVTDVNQYNGDARKAATLAQFKASNLPSRLTATKETTCHA